MLEEYVIVPDVFDQAAYSNAAFIEMCLPHLKEPLLQEAVVRDLYDGGWSQFCMTNSGKLHRLCKEIVKKLVQNNRLRRFPCQAGALPASSVDWCQEGLNTSAQDVLTGVISSHTTKQSFAHKNDVASIEKLTGSSWWQNRSPSATVDRKTIEYLRVLRRVLLQANSLMFIDPNLDPSSHNYREFIQLFAPLTARTVKPRIEIHRSFCKGDGPARTFPNEADWKVAYASLSKDLAAQNLTADVFFWDDFHERYLVTDVIGISVPAGFDVTAKPNDWSTWGRLGRDDKDKIQRLFDPAARQASLKWRFTIG
ncbi:hypothetical protein A2T82_04145 [Burkholderia cenocepacia]|uniref:hypothetical protein n=1 Tax=Burkholderia cenocepacia TaxID=95486 RepID=UPI00078BEB79|nr:hypothetical protein [Burkholderia cenocepacia]AMU05501.1 hypothetical protein A2T82_04145 [Burkholderia cenocepacia]